MIPRIKHIEPKENFVLRVQFDDGKVVDYDVNDDIKTIDCFKRLKNEYGLFNNFAVDDSRTCVYWNDQIDLASDTIYEYGTSPK